jgi:hypothetical protein
MNIYNDYFFIETKITGLVGGTGDVPVWKYRGWGGVRWRNISWMGGGGGSGGEIYLFARLTLGDHVMSSRPEPH